VPRRRLTLLALATLATAFAVTTIGAAAAPQGGAPQSAPQVAEASAAPAPAAGTVTDSGAASAEQTVSVGVRAGDLSVAPTGADIVLTRDDSTGAYRGVLPRVTVTDARGSLVGWTATAHLQLGDASASVDVVPATPVVVAGFADGVSAGAPTHAIGTTDAALATAVRGEGGGTFATPGAMVTVRTAHPNAATLAVHVTFAVR